MSEMLEWRERLEGAHKQMQDSEAERILHAVDKLMLRLRLIQLLSMLAP